MPTAIIQGKGSAGKTLLDFEVSPTYPYGCPIAAADRRPWNIPFNSNEVTLARSLNQAETIRGDRNPSQPYQGNKDVTGGLVTPISFIQAGLFFKAAVGDPTTIDQPTSVSLGGTASIAAGGVTTFSIAQTGILIQDRVRMTYDDGTVVDGYVTTRTSDVLMTIKLDAAGVSDLPGIPQTAPAATLTLAVNTKVSSGPITVTIVSGVATFSSAQTFIVGDYVIYDGSTKGFITSVTSTTVYGISDAEGFEPADTGGAKPVETVEAAPKWAHTSLIHPTNSIPSFALVRGFQDLTPNEEWFTYLGCKVNTLSLEATAVGDTELLMTMDIIGADETTGTTPYDDSPAPTALNKSGARFENFDATAKEAGVAITLLKTFSMEVNNNLDTESFTIGGGGTRAALPEGIAGVSGAITALFVNDDLLAKAQNNTETSLELILTQGTDTLNILFPEVKLQQNSPVISSAAGVELNLEFQAYFDDNVESSAIKVVLVNDQASYEA